MKPTYVLVRFKAYVHVKDGDKIPLITKEITKKLCKLSQTQISHVNNNIQIYTHKQILKKNKYKCVKQLLRKRENNNQSYQHTPNTKRESFSLTNGATVKNPTKHIANKPKEKKTCYKLEKWWREFRGRENKGMMNPFIDTALANNQRRKASGRCKEISF